VAKLVLGPQARYVGDREATVWVETDAPCEVEVLGHRSPTFHVEGHHYGLLLLEGLEPGGVHPYDVVLDGERRWPEDDSPFPASSIRTLAPGRPVTLLFGSCRAAAPHHPPFSLPVVAHEDAREVDALFAHALRMRDAPREEWPDAVLLLGDQVYADEAAPRTRDWIRRRRDTTRPPGEGVADFEEYTSLYHESWQDPAVRWLLSCVASPMIWDDHDVHDDWNISASWIEEMRRKPWWGERLAGAYMTYWLYQHLGNLAPAELREDDLLRRVREADDGGPILREFAERADREAKGSRWSYARDFSGTRLVVLDSRAGRLFEDGRREMVDDEEWAWIVERTRGEFDHLVLASTLPMLLPNGIHGLEAWNEATCRGAWGGWFAGAAERIRRGIDLEHWAAFESSFAKLVDLLVDVASGRDGHHPGSILLLGGDVHFSYLAEARFRRDAGAKSPLYQAVSSPIRNPLGRKERWAQELATSPFGEVVGLGLARLAGVERPDLRWEMVRGPWFHNGVGTIGLDGRRARIGFERTLPGDGASAELQTVYEQVLTEG